MTSHSSLTADRPMYVIINDIDAPEPRMVCQWVPNIGYCYLDRSRGKPSHDGMHGSEATPVEAFGFAHIENHDGTVSFFRTTRPVTSAYRDGQPRRWQHRADAFEFRRLSLGAVQQKEPTS